MTQLFGAGRYPYFALAMLTLVYVFNFVDRQLVVILQESIKKELLLTDTQLGLLSGFSFALFYVSLGLPIARLADKSNRKNIVGISLGLWSLMTALCGAAGNFGQLLLARIGVGVGEAGGSPPAHAMISDYFEPQKRATALSVYSSGIYAGILVGFLMGGYLNQQLGWRAAFYVLGATGLVFSVIFGWIVKEPARGATDPNSNASNHYTIRDVVMYLAGKRSFVYLALASALHVFCIYGISNWASSFLARLHHMAGAQIGLALGLLFGIGGAAGSFIGGYIADKKGKIQEAWYLKIPAICAAIGGMLAIGALFVNNTTLTLAFLGLLVTFQSGYLGPCLGVSHNLVPASMRALTSAVFFLIINLLGLGLGPLAVGMLSDALAPTLHAEALRWAMAIVILIELLAAFLFLVAARRLRADLATVH